MHNNLNNQIASGHLLLCNNAVRMSPPSLVAVDIFCGAGGLTHGLEKARIPVAFGVDLDPACKFPYEQNNSAKFVLESVETLKAAALKSAFAAATHSILAGCAPCQPFSKYRLGKSDNTDGRWHLLQHFQRLVLETKPTIVTMENVPRLAEQEIFSDFVDSLTHVGFHVSYEIVNCAAYGVPQQRERLVLLASRLGELKMISPTHPDGRQTTVRHAIGHTRPLQAGGRDAADSLHLASQLSPLNYRRMRASGPGGTWRDWDPILVADCHRKRSGKTYPSVYGRMVWDEPAPTITTQFYGFGNGRFGHPEQDRALSLREGALLQSFPKRYRFTRPGDPVYMKIIGRLIGNAVPVKLAKAIGRSIVRHVEKHEQFDRRKNTTVRH
jgi:DNA (cytosine-5)-methyltransferase 1